MSSLTEGLVIMADPDFHAEWLREQVAKVRHANRTAHLKMSCRKISPVSEDEIARESRHDELVELMNGFAV
jgi:hypothetical protein